MERWNGLTALDGGASFPSGIIPAVQFLASNFAPAAKESLITVADQALIIPESGLCEIPGGMVIHGDPTDSLNFQCWTEAGMTGTQYTPIDDQVGSVGAGEVRVRKGTGRLDFPVADAGNTVYLTFRTAHGGMTAALAARIWGEIRAVQTLFIRTLTAGQAWDNQAMYAGGDGKAYVADVTNFDKQGWGIGVGSGSANQSVTLIRWGIYTPPDITPPIGKPIFVGRNGLPTWDGDESANALQSGDWVKPMGVSLDGESIEVCLVGNVVRQQP